MNGNGSAGVDVELADKIKWWDALDTVVGELGKMDVARGLELARECQHPDARWLASLFPAGEAVTRQGMVQVMRQHCDDPRAMYLLFMLNKSGGNAFLERAASLGYAPAQAQLSCETRKEMRYRWAERASNQGDRYGTFRLAFCFRHGLGCEEDKSKAIELFKEAAELDCPYAQEAFGLLAFSELDWERFLWLGRAALRQVNVRAFCEAAVRLLPLFEKGDCGRILHTVAPVLEQLVDFTHGFVLGDTTADDGDIAALKAVVQLHEAMLNRARLAIACWCVAARRLGLVKDIRVVIAKMAWQEPWRWSISLR
jgi:hypothetical protein